MTITPFERLTPVERAMALAHHHDALAAEADTYAVDANHEGEEAEAITWLDEASKRRASADAWRTYAESVGKHQVVRIGPCRLTLPEDQEDPEFAGHWRRATCDEYLQAIQDAGGMDSLKPWSTFTNMERSRLGDPSIFTEWGNDQHPVAAEGGLPEEWSAEKPPCRMIHAVFVVAS